MFIKGQVRALQSVLRLSQSISWGRSSSSGRAIGSVITAAALFLALATVLPAQVSTADIVGTVADSTNAVVPGVKVTATNLATGLPYVGVSNESGDFSIPQLPTGHYSIVIDKAGFKSWRIADVALTSGDRFRVSPRLEPGSMEQSIEVVATSVALQTDTATVGSAVNQTEIRNLPLNGRNLIDLSMYVAGADDYKGGGFSGTPDDKRRNSTVSVNGRTGAENNFLIDGMDNNERFVNTILVKPSMEGVAEMRVVTNSFSAELSRTGGAAIVFITKGGTNELHGSAFEYLRNQDLDARPPNLAATASKPPYKQHNFGGSIGGPVKKNKAFFFADWETYMSNLGGALLATVPTAAMIQGNFAGSQPYLRRQHHGYGQRREHSYSVS